MVRYWQLEWTGYKMRFQATSSPLIAGGRRSAARVILAIQLRRSCGYLAREAGIRDGVLCRCIMIWGVVEHSGVLLLTVTSFISRLGTGVEGMEQSKHVLGLVGELVMMISLVRMRRRT